MPKVDLGRPATYQDLVDARHAWLVDPIIRTLEVLRLDGTRCTLLDTHTGNATVRAEPFEVMALELGLLWEDGTTA